MSSQLRARACFIIRQFRPCAHALNAVLGWARCDDETVEMDLSIADVIKNAAGNNNESASFLIYTDDHSVKVKMAGAVMAPGWRCLVSGFMTLRVVNAWIGVCL